MNFLSLGKRGEAQALRYLAGQGYRILERNVRSRMGEIDCVARDGGILCFVEIKSRSSLRFGFPEEAVTLKKQWRIARLASSYLKRRGLKNLPVRFDVVSILEGPAGPCRIRLIKGAFEAQGPLL
ncbi:MAG: YraN family protein [Candidatus Omnitrophica bacterium]|nr:YraN family protein [Candidatus Omnitrophota bacterium]